MPFQEGGVHPIDLQGIGLENGVFVWFSACGAVDRRLARLAAVLLNLLSRSNRKAFLELAFKLELVCRERCDYCLCNGGGGSGTQTGSAR